MSVGEKIKAARKNKGMSQKQLAEKLDVSETMVSQYERGLKNPKIETIDKIAAAIGVPIRDLADNLSWQDYQKTEESKAIEREADTFNDIVSVLRDIYGAIEEKSVYLPDKGEIPYWFVGKGEKVFFLYEGDIQALCDSVKGSLPPIVENMKDTRTEQEIIDELTAILNGDDPPL